MAPLQSITITQSIGSAAGNSQPAGAAALSFPHLRDVGAIVLRRLMTPDSARSLARDLLARKSAAQLPADSDIDGAFAASADPFFEFVLRRAQPLIEQIVAAPLDPTYSYARLYLQGNELPRHVDREACEVSVSVALGAEADYTWPFGVTYAGRNFTALLDPGDALLYLGIDCEHWREPLPAAWSAHLFLHYVFRDGAYAGYRFDQQPPSVP